MVSIYTSQNFIVNIQSSVRNEYGLALNPLYNLLSNVMLRIWYIFDTDETKKVHQIFSKPHSHNTSIIVIKFEYFLFSLFFETKYFIFVLLKYFARKTFLSTSGIELRSRDYRLTCVRHSTVVKIFKKHYQ